MTNTKSKTGGALPQEFLRPVNAKKGYANMNDEIYHPLAGRALGDISDAKFDEMC